jgi:hypothetical protein
MQPLTHEQVEIINYCLENQSFPSEFDKEELLGLINNKMIMDSGKGKYSINFKRDLFVDYYNVNENLRRLNYVHHKTIKTPIDINMLHKELADAKASIDIFGLIECRSDIDGIKLYKLVVEDKSEFNQRYAKYEASEKRQKEIETKKRYEEYLKLKAEFEK